MPVDQQSHFLGCKLGVLMINSLENLFLGCSSMDSLEVLPGLIAIPQKLLSRRIQLQVVLQLERDNKRARKTAKHGETTCLSLTDRYISLAYLHCIISLWSVAGFKGVIAQ